MRNNVLTFRFLFLCSLSFLALCNIAVFFDLHVYLLSLGIDARKAGFLVGLSSLTAMVLYATMSQRINLRNAYRSMLIGSLIVAVCGIGYSFVGTFWSLALLRVINGAGIFLIMASSMVVLVDIIPAEKSGRSFSIYSVALLAPYSIMPAVSEIVAPLINSPTTLYMATGCLLLPTALAIKVLWLKGKTVSSKRGIMGEAGNKETEPVPLDEKKENLLRKPVLSILLVNGIYFTLFSGLFYLFAGFAVSKGFKDPGFFFTIQMGVMVAIRLVGGGIFDIFSKVLLVSVSLLITGGGFLLLSFMPVPPFFIAVVFGLGMGLCIPPLNALMYLVSRPKYRGYNANMMMLAVHFGSFTGPFMGALIIDAGGYGLFLLLAALLTVCGAIFFAVANPAREVGKVGEVSHPETATKHCS